MFIMCVLKTYASPNCSLQLEEEEERDKREGEKKGETAVHMMRLQERVVATLASAALASRDGLHPYLGYGQVTTSFASGCVAFAPVICTGAQTWEQMHAGRGHEGSRARDPKEGRHVHCAR